LPGRKKKSLEVGKKGTIISCGGKSLGAGPQNEKRVFL